MLMQNHHSEGTYVIGMVMHEISAPRQKKGLTDCCRLKSENIRAYTWNPPHKQYHRNGELHTRLRGSDSSVLVRLIPAGYVCYYPLPCSVGS